VNRLAVADRSATASNTNLSRSISFSLLDRDGNEVTVQTNLSQPIEIIIPRDQNLPVPPMILQNVTSLSLQPHAQTFNLHFVNLSTLTSSFSIHLQMRPLNSNLSYVLIYAFDRSPRLNSSINDIDGWSLFCCSLSLHTYFLDNQQTTGHQSIVFGIRQLNAAEVNHWCTNQSTKADPPRSDGAFHSTDNYELRLFTSGCFYLDADHRWRSDGLLLSISLSLCLSAIHDDLLQVGPSTNLSHTQCFSTHLTTFAGGFLALPEPIHWNYAFAEADLDSLTLICAAIVFLVSMMYARRTNKKEMSGAFNGFETEADLHFTFRDKDNRSCLSAKS
jgi:hypothetical protein